MLASRPITRSAVTADRGDAISVRDFALGRWARLAVTVALVGAAVMTGVFVLSAGSAESVADVTVVPGDSLWSIAQAADPGADPRGVVDAIRQLNALDGDVVAVGAVLRVPSRN